MEQLNEVQQPEKTKKSRHLSTLDFYQTIQVEYLVAELRANIYPKIKDKYYWNKVMQGKKATIEKLSLKNNLPSIFTDGSMLRELQNIIYRPVSIPVFTYRDEEQRQNQEFYDYKYYFNRNESVRVDTEDGVITGRIDEDYYPFSPEVRIVLTGTTKPVFYPISIVTRIL